MKIGFRKPSIKKSIKARTTGKIKRQMKSAVNPTYGKKGMGWVNDPKKAAYNKIYNKTTVSAIPKTSTNKSNANSNSMTNNYVDSDTPDLNYYTYDVNDLKYIKDNKKIKRHLKLYNFNRIAYLLFLLMSLFGFFGFLSIPFAIISILVIVSSHKKIQYLKLLLRKTDDEKQQ